MAIETNVITYPDWYSGGTRRSTRGKSGPLIGVISFSAVKKSNETSKQT